jgi:hypothetical protein
MLAAACQVAAQNGTGCPAIVWKLFAHRRQPKKGVQWSAFWCGQGQNRTADAKIFSAERSIGYVPFCRLKSDRIGLFLGLVTRARDVFHTRVLEVSHKSVTRGPCYPKFGPHF